MQGFLQKITAFSASCLLWVSVAEAGLTPDELAKLDNELTPFGAIKAGNEEGSIPAWEGGLTSPPEGYKKSGALIDPYAEDKVQFTISAENMDKYAAKLTAGHQAMLKTYSSFNMPVYPSRRSAAAPQRIYDKTKEIAATAALTEDGNGVTGAINGIPFPIPKSGLEAVWNHILRWRGESVDRSFGLFPVTRDGGYTMVKLNEKADFPYAREGATVESLDNVIALFKQKIEAPPRLAGQILLVHETLDQSKEHRRAWLYNPGQRRVRRAPNIAFDNPKEGGDGLTTSDTVDMYNGSPERYNWELLGRKEMYVPYNSYKLRSDQLKYEEIIKPLHLNPDVLRYELHRVWVVEGTLKSGMRHIYNKRRFYLDEDSWQILAMDQYDSRDQLWRVSEGHGVNYYQVPNYWTAVEVHYDLQSGRYIALNLNNEEQPYNFDVNFSNKEFTTSAVRREGRR